MVKEKGLHEIFTKYRSTLCIQKLMFFSSIYTIRFDIQKFYFLVKQEFYVIKHKQNIVKHNYINPLNAELNPICHFLAVLGAHHILHVSRIRVNDFVKIYSYFCSCIVVYIYIYVCVYIYTHIYTHTHIYIYIFFFCQQTVYITSMTDTYCCVYSTRLLIMDSRSVRNMQSSLPK